MNLPHRLRAQTLMLSVQFLLGMAVNLIGLPDETKGLAHIAVMLLLPLHVLVAIGLLVNSLLVIRLSAQAGPAALKLARLAAGSIILAMTGGVLTLLAPLSDLWSYVMAVAFLLTFTFYGRLLSKTRPGSS